MKKLILFLVLILLPLTVGAATQIDGVFYNLNKSTKTAEVCSDRRCRYNGDVVIPSTVTYEGTEYNVTSIGESAFSKCTEITSVTIPNSVTSIGKGIFYGCTNLTSIVIEEGNSKFDSRDNCNAIIETASNKLLHGCQTTTIPNSVTSIGNLAFEDCSGLTFINLPEGVTDIGESAFSGCYDLTTINIPNSVTNIGINAFNQCNALTKVEINNNAIVSKEYTSSSGSTVNVYFGDQVKEYVLGDDVTSIGKYAFWNSPNLTSVKMSNSVTNIGEFAFGECSKLTSIDMSDNLTSIGESAFSNCRSLTSITIPSGVTKIELWTFSGCGLDRVEIHSNAIVSKDYNYSGLSSDFGYYVKEYVLGEEIKGIGNYAFRDCKATSINIPDNVVSIGDSAFYNCSNLTSLYIPEKVASIGDNAFYNCNSLNSIQVESGNTTYDSRENCNALIKTADNTMILGCQNSIIPNTITTIGDNAFYLCAGLTSISIPNSVTIIGDNAFAGCNGLTAVNIPNNLISIGKYAFSHCKQLTEFTIPGSLTTIDEGAFFFCTGLTSIIISNSVTAIEYRAFTGCSGLTSIQVESGNAAYDSRDNCNAIIETASNTLIQGCQNTVIPNSVTSIGNGAFNQCINLTSICIPNGVTNIGRGAFADCSNLATIIIPSSITTIGDYAFIRCGLRDMYCYAEQLPEIGDIIFEYSCYHATLHVPEALIDTYIYAAQWMDFGSIVALTENDPKPTDIISAIATQQPTITECYDLMGRRLQQVPQKGIYIQNGRKYVVR